MTGAIADCERILESIWGQPANTITAFAFIGAGLVVMRFTSYLKVALALIATGIGSVLFHGPMPPGAGWAHDLTLAWLLVVVGLTGTHWERWSGWPALAVLGIALFLAPASGSSMTGVLGVAAIGSILWRDRTPTTLAALGLLTLGAVVGRLTSTGRPWCDPESLFQGHAFWHLASAVAVAVWVLGTDRTPRTDGL